VRVAVLLLPVRWARPPTIENVSRQDFTDVFILSPKYSLTSNWRRRPPFSMAWNPTSQPIEQTVEMWHGVPLNFRVARNPERTSIQLSSMPDRPSKVHIPFDHLRP
jgi:hypothetical protein